MCRALRHTQGTDDEWTLLSRELFEYDLRGRKIKTIHANGRSRSTQWMCCGALRETDENGITMSHAYNDYKQKIETIRSLIPTTPETITYRKYDVANRITKKRLYVTPMNLEHTPFGHHKAIIGISSSIPQGALSPEALANTQHNPLRYSCKVYDPETALTYYNYRYYNPTSGNWISRDPLEENAGLNLYNFVNNNPVYYFDQLGKIIRYEIDEEKCLISIKINIVINKPYKNNKKYNFQKMKQTIEEQVKFVMDGPNAKIGCCSVTATAEVRERDVGDGAKDVILTTDGIKDIFKKDDFTPDNCMDYEDGNEYSRSYAYFHSGTGKYYDNASRGFVYAHEVLHMMGVTDNYVHIKSLRKKSPDKLIRVFIALSLR